MSRIGDAAVVVAVSAAVLVSQFPSLGFLWTSAILLTIALVWLRGLPALIRGYFLTISLQAGQPLGLFRLALADIFIAPLLLRSLLVGVRERGFRIRSTLLAPLVLLFAAVVVGAGVGAIAAGTVTPYVLFNRLGGLVLLIAGYVALTRLLSTPAMVISAARWFVIGTGLGNAAALGVTAASFAGFDSGTVYLAGALRLNGWVGNPSLYAAVLMTAAFVELGLLSQAPDHGERRWLRWTNVSLLGIGLALTVSRSSWLAVACGAALMLAVHVVLHRRIARPQLAFRAVVVTFMVVPMAALSGILAVNLRSGIESVDDRMTTLRAASAPRVPVDVPAAVPQPEPAATHVASSSTRPSPRASSPVAALDIAPPPAHPAMSEIPPVPEPPQPSAPLPEPPQPPAALAESAIDIPAHMVDDVARVPDNPAARTLVIAALHLRALKELEQGAVGDRSLALKRDSTLIAARTALEDSVAALQSRIRGLDPHLMIPAMQARAARLREALPVLMDIHGVVRRVADRGADERDSSGGLDEAVLRLEREVVDLYPG
ncbi:MAG TPA: hypothetical protein VEA16_09745, partial [Vicinamibacterales bacterium]|nr:hypothetical protein [Vicinamibacterales bacterium]